jgi:hypothetical protein
MFCWFFSRFAYGGGDEGGCGATHNNTNVPMSFSPGFVFVLWFGCVCGLFYVVLCGVVFVCWFLCVSYGW